MALQQGTAGLRTGPVNAEPSQVLWKGTGTRQVENSREGAGPRQDATFRTSGQMSGVSRKPRAAAGEESQPQPTEEEEEGA